MCYEINYTTDFADSLQKTIDYWHYNLLIDKITISKFVQLIDKDTSMLSYFPEMGQDVTSEYALLRRPTHRLSIGKEYMIFYRIDKTNKKIYVGSLFNRRQKNVPF